MDPKHSDDEEQERLRKLAEEQIRKKQLRENFSVEKKHEHSPTSSPKKTNFKRSPKPGSSPKIPAAHNSPTFSHHGSHDKVDPSKLGGKNLGYHTVTVPLSHDAKSAIQKFKSKNINFLELVVSDDEKSINVSEASNIQPNALSTKANSTLPRFYTFDFNHVTQIGQHKTATLFIYWCPSKSSTQARMLYATTKSSLVDQLEKEGLSFSKNLEISSSEELTEKSLVSELYFQSAQAFQGHHAHKTTLNVIDKPHPLFGSKNVGKSAHKVVIPPSDAYGSSNLKF